MTNKTIVVQPHNAGERIDLYLTRELHEYSRGYSQRMIHEGKVWVNHKNVASSYRVKPDDIVEYSLLTRPAAFVAEHIPLEILHEDSDIVVINKHPGIVVHPAAGHASGTVLNALLGRAQGTYTPFLVHRLDKDTSGVMVVAKNERAKNSLVKQFQHRDVKKKYFAFVKGVISETRGRIEAPLGRSPQDRKKIIVGPMAKKMAITEFRVLKKKKEVTLIEAYLITGRTHQIRSHLAYIGHPVLGDMVYEGPKSLRSMRIPRQMLHSHYLSFTHPSQNKKVEYSAPLPEDMATVWSAL